MEILFAKWTRSWRMVKKNDIPVRPRRRLLFLIPATRASGLLFAGAKVCGEEFTGTGWQRRRVRRIGSGRGIH